MLGMVIAAMFSATMSTLAGDCNAMSSVLTNDFYKRFINTGSSDKHLLIVGRINTVIVGIIILGITLVMRSLQESKDLFDTMAKVFGVFLPPVAIPMLMGMLTPKVSSAGGKYALFGGIVSGLAFFVIGATHPWFRTAQALTFLTSSMTLLGLILGSLLQPDTGERKQRVEIFFERFAKPVELAEHDTATQDSGIASFLPVIAGGIASMGFILILSVLATVGFAKGSMSVYVGTTLILVAFGLWATSKWQRKESA
jgi:Na+/proline symporter